MGQIQVFLIAWINQVGGNLANFRKDSLHPPFTALRKDGLQVAFKHSPGVLEVLFGVGFGGGDAVKRFVEDADDALLFGERRYRDRKRGKLSDRNSIDGRAPNGPAVEKLTKRRRDVLVKEKAGGHI